MVKRDQKPFVVLPLELGSARVKYCMLTHQIRDAVASGASGQISDSSRAKRLEQPQKCSSFLCTSEWSQLTQN